MPLLRKSALKPSREIRIVVGAKRDDPLERSLVPGGSCDFWWARYAPKANAKKRTIVDTVMIAHIVHLRL